MALFVADASATLPWYFEDESTPWSENLLDRVQSGDGVVVPAHWPVEITNGMLMAVRRKRISMEKVQEFLEAITELPIALEPALTAEQRKRILLIGELQNLTVYDAVYLELAERRGLPLATLDIDLKRAAKAAGLVLL